MEERLEREKGPPILIVVADDHTIVRQGLVALLDQQHDFRVIAQAEDGLEAVRLVREHQPHVLVLDLAMPGLHGLDVCAAVVKEVPQCRILVLSMHGEQEMVNQARQAGAAAFLVKGAGIGELVSVVRQVVGQAQSSFFASASVENRSAEPALTPREMEVLRLVAEGYTTKQIAMILDLSPKTADSHRQNLMAKLDIHDVAGLVRYALRCGLVGV